MGLIVGGSPREMVVLDEDEYGARMLRACLVGAGWRLDDRRGEGMSIAEYEAWQRRWGDFVSVTTPESVESRARRAYWAIAKWNNLHAEHWRA